MDKNLITPYQAPQEQIEKEIKLALRDLKVAQKNLEEDYDWAFTIAYNAVLQAGRALTCIIHTPTKVSRDLLNFSISSVL